MRGRYATHRLSIRVVLRRDARLRIEAIHVADAHRFDKRLLFRAGVSDERESFLNGCVRALGVVWGHPSVDVRAPGPGFTPVAYRAGRVAPLRLAERSTCFRFGEGVHQLEALIEVGLRFGILGGDRSPKGSETNGVQPNRLVK